MRLPGEATGTKDYERLGHAVTIPKPKRTVNKELLAEIRKQPCCVCGKRPSEPSHIRTRGAGGHDEPDNVVPKCRRHHREWHDMGATKFIARYPVFKIVLISRGWIETPYGFRLPYRGPLS